MTKQIASRPCRKEKRARGFSLVEMLIATVILLVGLVGYLIFDMLAFWASFRAVGASPELALIWMAYLIGQLGNWLPIPGGIGGTELGLVGALVLYGLPALTATAAVLLPSNPTIAGTVSNRRRPPPEQASVLNWSVIVQQEIEIVVDDRQIAFRIHTGMPRQRDTDRCLKRNADGGDREAPAVVAARDEVGVMKVSKEECIVVEDCLDVD